MKIILTGATGRIGGAALQSALSSPAINTVIVLSRRNIDIKHAKLQTIIKKDYTQYSAEELAQLEGAEACIWYAHHFRHPSPQQLHSNTRAQVPRRTNKQHRHPRPVPSRRPTRLRRLPRAQNPQRRALPLRAPKRRRNSPRPDHSSPSRPVGLEAARASGAGFRRLRSAELEGLEVVHCAAADGDHAGELGELGYSRRVPDSGGGVGCGFGERCGGRGGGADS